MNFISDSAGDGCMALRIEYVTPYGITCSQAHCVVVGATCDREQRDGPKTYKVHFNGRIYADVQAYDDDKSPIGGFNGSFELNSGDSKNQYNLVKQCYEHLKTMSGFDAGVDC